MSDQKTPSLHQIGKVHSSQGVRGEMFIVLGPESVPWVKRWKTLHLTDKSGVTRSYPILSKREHAKQGHKGFVLTVEGITSKEAAEALNGQRVSIPEDFLVSKAGETIFLREIENFLVVDKVRGEVGPIVGFSSNGPQDLIEVKTAKGVYSVPLVKPFIEKIDFDAKKIHMDIPDGLLEDVE